MPAAKRYGDNHALLRSAQDGNESARAEIYEANLGLISLVLQRFKGSAAEQEDLFQVGAIGLLKAIDRFDFSYEVQFSTYAVPMIIGEIKRFLRDDGIIKVQRSVRENYLQVRRAQERLAADLGREPRLDELAAETGMEREEIVMALEACRAPASIDETSPGEENEALSLMERIIGEDGSAAMLEQIALREAVAALAPREQEIILRRYFRDETQTVIAADLALSQVQVSRLEKKALAKLREALVRD
ncbi:MAG: SigB/SigF/SigG family RNA polymerase sigma factor [Syntrophomonadaceae bacterium]|nr:SigB/SigF/SigG family RNA polymerase sigma factor [Syntrophomonadaceae bacterium]